MAYVSVPKDLTKVKNKVAFNLTKRQLITIMVLLMLPAFLFAMYEKDGMHLEEVLIHMIRVKWLRPAVRKYETENYFETDPGKSVSVTVKKTEKGGKNLGRKKR